MSLQYKFREMLRGVNWPAQKLTFHSVAINIFARDESNMIMWASGLTVPVDTTAGYAKGCIFIKTNAAGSAQGIYFNNGTVTSSLFQLNGVVGALGILTSMINTKAVTTAKIDDNAVTTSQMDPQLIQIATGSITAADIVATGAGKLGHANGYPLVAGISNKLIELISAVIAYDYATAAYGGGGNVSINLSGGGAALTGVATAGASFGAASDNINIFRPLTTVAVAQAVSLGLNLVAASAFTNPGTAAGIINYRVLYRVHATLLD